ncbi:hypothetical protein DITRI_Ditri16bG0130900 [Diplodiscus trichospermus]
MGNWFNKEPSPPVVLVPPLAARTRMLESSYNMLFGKLALKCLFEEARHSNAIIMLKPIDDPHVDLMGKIGPLSLSLALAMKSWWKPSFNISFSASMLSLAISS